MCADRHLLQGLWQLELRQSSEFHTIGSVAFVTYKRGFHGGVLEEHTASVFRVEEVARQHGLITQKVTVI
jgi:hypothetical protein